MKFTRIRKIFKSKKTFRTKSSSLSTETKLKDENIFDNYDNDNDYTSSSEAIKYQEEFSSHDDINQNNTEIMMISPSPERFCPLYVIYEEDEDIENEQQNRETNRRTSSCSSTSLKKQDSYIDLTSLTALDGEFQYRNPYSGDHIEGTFLAQSWGQFHG